MKSTGIGMGLNLTTGKVYRHLHVEIEVADLKEIHDALADRVMVHKLQGKTRTRASRLHRQVERVIKMAEGADKSAVRRAKKLGK